MAHNDVSALLDATKSPDETLSVIRSVFSQLKNGQQLGFASDRALDDASVRLVLALHSQSSITLVFCLFHLFSARLRLEELRIFDFSFNPLFLTYLTGVCLQYRMLIFLDLRSLAWPSSYTTQRTLTPL